LFPVPASYGLRVGLTKAFSVHCSSTGTASTLGFEATASSLDFGGLETVSFGRMWKTLCGRTSPRPRWEGGWGSAADLRTTARTVEACQRTRPVRGLHAVPETRGYVARVLGLLGDAGDLPPGAGLEVRLVE
jgi:hypothetical protein